MGKLRKKKSSINGECPMRAKKCNMRAHDKKKKKKRSNKHWRNIENAIVF
jgi:hypothetical protein